MAAPSRKSIYHAAKRVHDIVVAGLVLTAVAPLIGLAAAWIKLASPGPVFYSQRRVGLMGRSFAIFKLRTMTLQRENEARSTVTTRNDQRVIRGGWLLRRSKLDELPQLLNVLRGEMSLVGPRPTVQADYDRMDTRQRLRCHTLPGLTGLAQVRGNTSLMWPERIEYDLRYLREQSMLFDLRILIETAFLVLTARSHTDPPGEDEWRQAA